MLHRPVMAVAEGFEKFGIGTETQDGFCGPRLQISLGIVDRDGEFHVSEVDSTKSFGEVQRIAVRASLACIDPSAIPETDRLDDERIAFPSTN